MTYSENGIVTDTNAETGRMPGPPKSWPLLIDGRWVPGDGERIAVLDKYRLEPFASVNAASPAQVLQMIESAHAAFRKGSLPAYDRGAILARAADLLALRLADFVATMQAEAGFTASMPPEKSADASRR